MYRTPSLIAYNTTGMMQLKIIVTLVLNFFIRWGSVINFTPHRLASEVIARYLFEKETDLSWEWA